MTRTGAPCTRHASFRIRIVTEGVATTLGFPGAKQLNGGRTCPRDVAYSVSLWRVRAIVSSAPPIASVLIVVSRVKSQEEIGGLSSYAESHLSFFHISQCYDR